MKTAAPRPRAYVPAQTSELDAESQTREGSFFNRKREAERSMSVVTILILVVVVLLVVGLLGRRRI